MSTWWREAVFYQIYLRSFADGDGDGIGDLTGAIDRLDFLVDLGVDAIWLSPHYPSPLRDAGYDIADYTGVHPDYGTLDDLDAFVAGAHARGIRVVLDLVLNHTSDQHPWFLESRASLDSPKREWYLWSDGRDGGPPNDWVSQFGGSAWELDERTGQYYYHAFLPAQPDLNWRNGEVRAAMWDVVRFWLDRGVDGFRLDAIGNLLKDPRLPDHASGRSLFDLWWRWTAATSVDEREAVAAGLRELFRHQIDQPEIHDLLRDLRRVVDAYPDRVLVGETDDVSFYGHGDDELDLVFNFPLMRIDRITPAAVRQNHAARWATMPPGTWPANTLGNHDVSRVRTRYGQGADESAVARLCAALVLTLPGTPFLYNGEEIGMTDLILDDAGQFHDAWARWFHDRAIEARGLTEAEARATSARFTRDRSRSPMQWTGSANAGFSPAGVRTWLPVNADHRLGVNAADQLGDAGSLLSFYRRLLRARRRTPALRRGDCRMLHEESEAYLAFLRTSEIDRQACLVVLNTSDESHRLSFDLPADRLDTLVSSRPRVSGTEAPSDLTVAPYEIYIGELA
jgi:alpha-glucosidase